MKKLFSILAIVSVMGMFLVGCKGADEGGEASGDAAKPADTAEKPAGE